ncbi:hypothetical protein MKW92_034079 [Papaver armeniacum]|nr:hypothetical protein MKW92_034079 [Papaver armeniacum]
MEVRRQKMPKLAINLETDLCLGLPGGGGGGMDGGGSGDNTPSNFNLLSGKRGYSDTSSVDLKLNLILSNSKESVVQEDSIMEESKSNNNSSSSSSNASHKETKNLLPNSSCTGEDDQAKPSAPKTQVVGWPPVRSSGAQVVGWPPVRSYRKNVITSSIQKNSSDEEEKVSGNVNPAFVKVSMDGAPYLRKVDLNLYSSYKDLSDALGKMFSSFTIGNCGPHGMKDFMNESKLMDLLNGSEYLPTYEDKDGDWMLVGDVPWKMFVDSCKRIRIMKGTDALGLAAPRAVEKCKNRS